MNSKSSVKNESKKLTIITIAMVIILVIIFTGVTYAFFTANNPEGSTAQIISKSGRMLINYNDGTDNIVPVTNIQPSNKILVNKTFTLTGSNTTSGLKMPYEVGLDYISRFSDGMIHYYVKRMNENSNITSDIVGTANQAIPGNASETGYTHGTLKKGNRYVKLATDTLIAKFDSETKTNEVSTSGLFIDNTSDVNLRYTGANPNNYVEFGNTGELWRIVGVFNVKDSTGKIERKIKLVRNGALGGYSWDTTGNNNYGFNDWTEADLMKELNGDYLNTTLTSNRTNWYNSYWDSSTSKPVLRQTGVFDYTKVIKSTYQNMISESVWNIGGNDYTGSAPYTLNLLTQYNRERDKITYQNSRPTTWTGKIGLIYASDYGYASTLAECHENLVAGVKYDTSNNSWDYSNGKCKTDNWLAKTGWYWTLSPYSGDSSRVFDMRGDGAVDRDGAYLSRGVFPAVFLKSDILIASGNGEKNSPYRLG